MTPVDRERRLFLQAKEREGILSGTEARELDALGDRLRTSQLEAIPKPTCCAAVQRYRPVYLAVTDDTAREAVWRTVTVPVDMDPNRRDSEWWEGVPVARFCPYCGAPLPEMVLKAEPPEPLCRVEDGGYYCATCRERGHACTCYPREAAFTPKSS